MEEGEEPCMLDREISAGAHSGEWDLSCTTHSKDQLWVGTLWEGEATCQEPSTPMFWICVHFCHYLWYQKKRCSFSSLAFILPGICLCPPLLGSWCHTSLDITHSFRCNLRIGSCKCPGHPRWGLRELARDETEQSSSPEMKGLQARTDGWCQEGKGEETSSLIKLSCNTGVPRNKDYSLPTVDGFSLRPFIPRWLESTQWPPSHGAECWAQSSPECSSPESTGWALSREPRIENTEERWSPVLVHFLSFFLPE